jgi:hypothetical protein
VLLSVVVVVVLTGCSLTVVQLVKDAARRAAAESRIRVVIVLLRSDVRNRASVWRKVFSAGTCHDLPAQTASARMTKDDQRPALLVLRPSWHRVNIGETGFCRGPAQ